MKILFSFFLFTSTLVLAQENEIGSSVSVRSGWSPYDIFIGLEYQKQIHQQLFFSALELGARRSFYQSEMYPRISLGWNYFLLKRDKFQLGPGIQYMYSNLRVGSEKESLHQWHEFELNLRFQTNKRVKFYAFPYVGWSSEYYRDVITDTKENHGTIAYGCIMGVGYGF